MVSHQPATQKAYFNSCARKFAVKNFKETPILLNFVDLSIIPCSRLYIACHVHFKRHLWIGRVNLGG